MYHEHRGRYGYRRITAILNKEYNIKIHKNTVLKIMRKLKISSPIRIIKYHSYKGEVGRKFDNLLKRNFKTNQPRKKMVTDVTQINICNTKLYLSPLIDLYNGEILGYNISKSPNMKQIFDMLEMAFKDCSDCKGAILHSDQGWQYQQKGYSNYLKDKNIKGSMSRKGNCIDNACAESFFAVLKTELIYKEEFKSVEECISKIEEYICYYNNIRIKEKLGWKSPIDYRKRFQNNVA